MDDDILNVAKEVALEAGKIMMDYYGKDYNFSCKTDNSIQTEVDLKVDNFIRETLLHKYPEYSIMSEELPKLNQESDYMWIIDPIDGTSNYKHEIPFFCVSIALMDTKLNEPVVGVIYAPIIEELFYASEGRGSFLNSQPIFGNNESTLGDSFVAFGSSRKPVAVREIIQIYSRIKKVNHLFRQVGAAALELCFVACGRISGFITLDTNPWDVMAGVLIVREAKGIVTDFTGEYFTIKSPSLVASAPKLHPNLIEILKTAGGRQAD